MSSRRHCFNGQPSTSTLTRSESSPCPKGTDPRDYPIENPDGRRTGDRPEKSPNERNGHGPEPVILQISDHPIARSLLLFQQLIKLYVAFLGLLLGLVQRRDILIHLDVLPLNGSQTV